MSLNYFGNKPFCSDFQLIVNLQSTYNQLIITLLHNSTQCALRAFCEDFINDLLMILQTL
ncbi:hypothetical protein HMPREF3216_00306 [Gardnerella vaginalis]|uniref:Uncharacterized protein n=1 Tax=Gardnerella vaginalis TaxID=2702 RepID=A0A133NRG2_GARVA|nr:hypothetical protein HMPREF3216_00306 [Gardnerella vaginalis]